MKKIFVILFAALIFAGCGQNSQAVNVEEAALMKNSVTIQINEKNFSAAFENNPSAKKFLELLPLEVETTELNGNEKYFYLDENLPSDSVRVEKIHAGDVMLFGSNCVVIFYKDFLTGYSYTRLGKIENPDGLEKILGAGNVRVKFSKNF